MGFSGGWWGSGGGSNPHEHLLSFAAIDDTNSPYSVPSTVDVVKCDLTGGAVEVTLPDAANHSGRVIYVKIVDGVSSQGNYLKVSSAGGTIDSQPHIEPPGAGVDVPCSSDGSNWIIL